MILPTLALAADLCGSKTPPTGYRLGTGYGSGPRAQALEVARQRAIENALDAYGRDLTELQAAAFRKQVFDWSEDHWEPGALLQQGTACFRIAIADEAFTAHADSVDQLSRDLAALAAQVRARTATVEIDAPVWDQSGCPADIGAALRTTLLAHMAGVTETPGAPRLRVRLAALDTVVQAALTLDGASIGGFAFPLTTFGLSRGEVGRCASNGTLGLGADDRRGAGGLAVRVRLGAHVGEGCEGDSDNPTLVASAPVQAQVFSIDRDGMGHFVGTWSVNGQTALGEGTLAPMPSGGDERLVAVALPPGRDFGRTQGWADYCKLSSTFNASWFPAEAAIGTTTFIVHPAGTNGCGAVVSGATAVAAEAPVCR